MADDSILGLLFEISADPSKATAALKIFQDNAVVSTEKIQEAVQKATIALQQTQSQAFAATQLVAAGLTEEAAKATVAALAMRETAQQTDEWAVALGTANRGLTEAELATTDFSRALGASEDEGLNRSITKARLGLQEMEQLAGVRVPRGINTFLSSLEGIGPAVSAAFSTIAILGILDIVATQLPAAFEKLEGAITGWDKTAQKAYENQIKLNEKYLEVAQHTHSTLIDIQAQEEGLNRTGTLKLHIADKEKELTLQQKIATETQNAIQYQKEYSERLQMIAEGATGIDLPKPDPRSAEELANAYKTAAENAEKLALELQKMRGEDTLKAQAEDAKEETAAWFKGLEERLKKQKEVHSDDHKAAEEQKRLINEHLAEIQRQANAQLEIEQSLNKQLVDIDTSRLSQTEQVRLAKLKETNDQEAALQQAALERWYNAQSGAFAQAALQMKALFGAQSAEYQQAVGRIAALDNELLVKAQKIASDRAAANRRADEEIVKFHDEAVKALMEQDRRLSEEIAKELHATTMERVRDIVGASKERLKAEKDDADKTYQIEQQTLENRYRLHQISSGRLAQLEKQALQQWVTTQHELLDRQLAAAAAAYGTESKEYARLIREKEALDNEYLRRQQQISGLIQRSHRAEMNSALSSLEAIAGALRNHHALQVSLIVARAAIRVTEEIAAAYSAFAWGNGVAGALHLLSAAEYGIVAGAQAASGGGGSYGGGDGQSGPSTPPFHQPNMATQQGGSPGGTARIIIFGTDHELAQHIGKVLNTNVRNGNTMLWASHTLKKGAQ